MSVIEVARDGEVAVIRLNRPEKLNAISTEVERALHKAIASGDVRSSGAVILAGEGRAFSAGADISEFEGRSPEDVLRYYNDTGGVYEEFAALPQPTIAAIHGYCLGGDEQDIPAQTFARVMIPFLSVCSSGTQMPWLHDAAQVVADALPNGTAVELPGEFHQVPAATLAPALAEFFRD